MSSQEEFLKKKLESLDRRLTRIEKLEVRFRDYYTILKNDEQSFSTRAELSSPAKRPRSSDYDPELSVINSKDNVDAVKINSAIQLKKCFVKLIRKDLSDTGKGKLVKRSRTTAATGISNSSNQLHPTRSTRGTSKRIKIVQTYPKAEPIQVKEHENDRFEDVQEISSIMDVDDDTEYTASDKDEAVLDTDQTYFQFPTQSTNRSRRGRVSTPRKNSKNAISSPNETDVDEASHPDFRCNDDDFDNDSNFDAGESYSENSGVKFDSDGNPIKKRRKPQIWKKRKYVNKFGSHSMFKLSSASEIVSTDPSRGECPICHRHFVHEALPSHMALHAKERHIKCNQCEKTFLQKTTLYSHVLSVHKKDTYNRRCRHCGKPLVGNLLAHESYCLKKAWENEEEIDPKLLEDVRARMQSLGKSFELPDRSKRKEFDIHERKDCPVCHKSLHMQNYDRHVKSHEKSRNWRCSKCPKSYIYKHDLVRHIIQNHENIPTCEICNKTFDSRNDLRLHKLVCSKMNVEKSNLEEIPKKPRADEKEENMEVGKSESMNPIAEEIENQNE